jgi:AcrR family transcriptional regulator/DNA-binding Xre family transcriptional regulator
MPKTVNKPVSRREKSVARDSKLAIDGTALRAMRENRGFGLRHLSKSLGVSPATLSGIETGRVKVGATRLARIGELLGSPVSGLILPAKDSSDVRGNELAKPHWRDYPPLDLDRPLMAALDAFVEFGYHGANTRDIAQRCGLSVPGLYYHYATKQAMLVAILDYLMDDLIGRSSEAIAEGRTPAERFALLVECQTLFHAARRDLGFIGSSELRSLESPYADRNRKLRRRSKQFFDDEVAAGILSGEFLCVDPKAASRAVVSLCTALPLWFRSEGPQSPNEVALQYADYALVLVSYVGSRQELLRNLKIGDDV